MTEEKAYIIMQDCSHGRKGEIKKIKGELTGRQSRLMKEYVKPVATADESKELKALKAENAELKAKLNESEKALEVATPKK